MSDKSVKTNAFPTKTGLAATDTLVATWSNTSSTNTVQIAVSDLFGNTSGTIHLVANAPANSTANGTAISITADTNYVYVCTTNNVWRRVALSDW